MVHHESHLLQEQTFFLTFIRCHTPLVKDILKKTSERSGKGEETCSPHPAHSRVVAKWQAEAIFMFREGVCSVSRFEELTMIPRDAAFRKNWFPE